MPRVPPVLVLVVASSFVGSLSGFGTSRSSFKLLYSPLKPVAKSQPGKIGSSEQAVPEAHGFMHRSLQGQPHRSLLFYSKGSTAKDATASLRVHASGRSSERGCGRGGKGPPRSKVRLWAGSRVHAQIICSLTAYTVCASAPQALEEALAAYRIRHEQCTTGSAVPGKYVVTLMADDYAGLGNQLPSIITGVLV